MVIQLKKVNAFDDDDDDHDSDGNDELFLW